MSEKQMSSDIEVVRQLLEKAEIDFEEMIDERDGTIYIETTSGVYFSFEDEGGALKEVSNG